MKTYTEEHAKRLKALHDRDEKFGVIGFLWAEKIAELITDHPECESFLDYGCGRSNLAAAVVQKLHGQGRSCLRFKTQEWDPATKPNPTPEPADFVACIDVLEHVEKDKVDAVLSHIRSLMQKRGIITVSLRWSSPKKRLTHPNVWKREKWIEHFHKYFYVDEIMPLDTTKAKSELAVLVEPIK